jgi:large subunit ribosomal protein L19
MIQELTKKYLIKRPQIKPGDIVRVHQEVMEAKKKRIQVFEGMVIRVRGGKGLTSTFTVRRVSLGVGVEKIFPLHLPTVKKIEITKSSKIRRAKLYYLRDLTGKRARLKDKKLSKDVIDMMAIIEEESSINSNDQKTTSKQISSSDNQTEEKKTEQFEKPDEK